MAGESLLSWLDYMALDWGLPRGRVAELVGLLHEGGNPRDLLPSGLLMFGIGADAASRVAAATGLTAAEIDGMTLSRHFGVSVGLGPAPLNVEKWTALNDPGRVAVRFDRASITAYCSDDEWVHPGSVNICPRCLVEDWGRWPSSWYLPWVFLCPKHRCYLVSQCPGCGSQFEPFRLGFGKGLCGQSLRVDGQPQRGRGCDVEIDHLPVLLVEDAELLALQRRLLALLTPDEESQADAHQIFCDLWAMAFLVLYTGSPGVLTGADRSVQKAFRKLCSAFDEPGRRRRQNTDEAQGIHDPLLFAALFRIAAKVVFADDPHGVALALGLLQRRATAARQARWPYPRWAVARSAAGPRLSRVMQAVVNPREFAADQVSRAEVGLDTAP
ncbi:TniQ family protein [Kitasatospora sp. NPDC098652]|uniref:TniQ family protein n=1 Tax=Kitasatospora sp. NPDC098652 TaxID=3364095 RepID=UPI00380AF33B